MAERNLADDDFPFLLISDEDDDESRGEGSAAAATGRFVMEHQSPPCQRLIINFFPHNHLAPRYVAISLSPHYDKEKLVRSMRVGKTPRINRTAPPLEASQNVKKAIFK
jgi:hypothetical protein